jgi:Na+/phosphate symporter
MTKVNKVAPKPPKKAPKIPKKVKVATPDQVLRATKKDLNIALDAAALMLARNNRLEKTIESIGKDTERIENLTVQIEKQYEARIEELEKSVEEARSAHKDSLRFIKSLLEVIDV